jgi:hypothetical protein
MSSPGAKSFFVAQTNTVRFASFAIKVAANSEIISSPSPIAILEFFTISKFVSLMAALYPTSLQNKSFVRMI